MIHAIIALFVQIIYGLLTGDFITGGLVMCGFYLGREIAQAEYRWIEQYGLGRRSNMPWWGPFDLRVWKKIDTWFDWVIPIVAVSIAIVISFYI